MRVVQWTLLALVCLLTLAVVSARCDRGASAQAGTLSYAPLTIKPSRSPHPAPEGLPASIQVGYVQLYWSLLAEYPEAKWHRVTQEVYTVPAELDYWWDYYNGYVVPEIDAPNYGRHGEGYTSAVLTLKAMSDAKWENPRLPIGRVDGLVNTKYRWGYHAWNIVAVAPEGVCCEWYVMDTESPRTLACYYVNGENQPCVMYPAERGIFKKPAGWAAIGHVEL